LVKRWGRKEIVDSLLPLLHLSQDGKINILQEELFKEIFIKRKAEDEK
jgi:chromatin segregation and condensation protein Rec8/ScpA/Scc1 (kleisin family)